MAKDDLNQLAADMVIVAGKVGKNVDLTMQASALAATRELVFNTPVDTGKARSNWIASIGEEEDTVIAPHAPGRRLGIGETGNAAGAITAAAAVIATQKKGQDIVVQNNVHYIGLLNEGTSTQAPAGFVERAILAGVDAVQNSKLVD